MNENDTHAAERSAKKWVAALDEGVRDLPPATCAALYDRRRQAMAALSARHVGGGTLALSRHPGLIAAGVLLLLGVLVWVWMQPGPRQAPASLESGELDVLLLTGELPPQVFADWSLVTQENVEAVCLRDS
ncbi:MAG: DUF3619 family protein [Pseudomonadota bacterium]